MSTDRCTILSVALCRCLERFDAALPVLGSGDAMMFSVGGGAVHLFVFLE